MAFVDELHSDDLMQRGSLSVARLPGYAQSWREAIEIAEAYRMRLRTAVLEEIDAGLSITAAARLAGVSRVTVHDWLRAR